MRKVNSCLKHSFLFDLFITQVQLLSIRLLESPINVK